MFIHIILLRLLLLLLLLLLSLSLHRLQVSLPELCWGEMPAYKYIIILYIYT
jgi:hypothetical protein